MLTLGQLGCSSISQAIAHRCNRSSDRVPASLAHLILMGILHFGPEQNANIPKHKRDVLSQPSALFSSVQHPLQLQRSLWALHDRTGRPLTNSLINCGMNTERSLSLGGQAMSLHLSFPHSLSSSPCFSPTGREQTGTFFSHMPLPHAHWVGDIPLPLCTRGIFR